MHRISLALLFTSLPAFSASFTASTSCTAGQPGGIYSSSNGNPCQVTGTVAPGTYVGGPYSSTSQSARASASYTFDVTGNTFLTVLNVGAASTEYADATARLNFSDAFVTSGPVRTGIIIGTFSPGSDGRVSYGYTFPSQVYDRFGPNAPTTMFVTLGQEFPVTAFVGVRGRMGDLGFTENFGSVYFSLSFFEADGVTPVNITETPMNITETPEPSTWLLCAVALILLAGVRFGTTKGIPLTLPARTEPL